MRFYPHDYQRFVIDYIKNHPIAAVFLDMGLGKTSVTLSAILDLMFDSFEIRKVLVIAPLRVARDTWIREVVKWDHLSMLRVSVAVGTVAERMAALREEADVYVINRENVPWLVDQCGLRPDIDMLVVDELSSFKSAQAKRFRALMKIRPAFRRVVGLTGTPSANSLMDLWAEFRLLDMGQRLGRFISQYRGAYFTPDKRNAQVVFSYRPLPGAETLIYERIKDVTVSMKAADYLQMPERVDVVSEVILTEKDKDKYESLRQDLVLEVSGQELTASNAASLSGKLLQMANGAVYTDDGAVVEIHSGKLDMLEDLLEAANGKPLLVAYWFKHDLLRISEKLRALGIRFECLDSSDSFRHWNDRELQVGLIHPASAGHGLNLQEGGNTIIWFGLTWSLELYQQTNARLLRQGQKAGTVVVQHIVTKGTIDERVMEALKDKSSSQDRLIEAVKAELKG